MKILTKHQTGGVLPTFDFYKRALREFASKHINSQGSYSEAFSKKPNKLHPLSNAAFQKYLGKPYDHGMLIKNNDGSYRLPSKTENQIVVDTNFVKNRLNQNTDKYRTTIQSNPEDNSLKRTSAMMNADIDYLNKLRQMYKTGNPIVVNEFQAWKDRKTVNNGAPIDDPITPLNVLQNFTIRPNEKTGNIEYYDKYDLDKIPFLDKIFNPFEIKGNVPGAKYIKKKLNGGKLIKMK